VLATIEDLDIRNVEYESVEAAEAMLRVASDAVTSAAGSPILRRTSTVRLVTQPGRVLRLPGGPVRAVTEVLLDGEPVDDWALRGNSLWRRTHWQRSGIPSEVTVTYEHGRDKVPADIVNLVCLLAAAGLNMVQEDFEAKSNLAYESIDDYRVGYQQGQDGTVSAMELPPRTAQMLRRRFGTHSSTVIARS